MDVSEPSQVLLFGITLRDVVTAILIPIVAVLTTLVVQERQQVRERRMQILRMLLATRHLPSSPEYNSAINLIPLEFHRDKEVMGAWRTYIDVVGLVPVPGDELNLAAKRRTKQTKLITAVMARMQVKHSEADIQADAYASEGFVNRDNLHIDSLMANRDAAEAMKGVEAAMKLQTRLLYEQLHGKPPENNEPYLSANHTKAPEGSQS